MILSPQWADYSTSACAEVNFDVQKTVLRCIFNLKTLMG